MAANAQEQLIKSLSESTMGRRSVFEPHEYAKGNARREPADVAWFSRDAVVLMYLKASKKGWQHDTEKNFRQAHGWLTAWRSGRALQGDVREGALSVPHRPTLAVMVLSVSSDPALTDIVRHDDVARQFGVDACATISETFLQAIADDYLGVADVALLLREWPQAQARTPLSDIEFFHGFCSAALAKAQERAGWRPTIPPIDDIHLLHVIDIIRRFRSVVETLKPGATPTKSHPNELFSDFTIAEQWQLFYTFGRAIELVREGMPFQQIETRIRPYKIAVQVAERAVGWIGRVTGEMVPRDCDLVLNYVLGLDMMQFGSGPTLSLRSPTVAWRAIRGLRCPPSGH
jgi:hypothetical protein